MYRNGIILFLFAILASATLTASTVIADSPQPLKEKSGPTFVSKVINTLTGNNYTWLLGGNWDFQSINGITDSFNVDMTMIPSDVHATSHAYYKLYPI